MHAGAYLLIAQNEAQLRPLQQGHPEARAQLLGRLCPQLGAHLHIYGRALLLLRAAWLSTDNLRRCRAPGLVRSCTGTRLVWELQVR